MTEPRQITIKIPRLPKDRMLWFAGGIGFLIAFVFASSVFSQLNDLKKQQETTEERIKKEVLMPGGTNSYETEFKPDPKVDTAKDSVTEAPAPAKPPVTAPEPPAAAQAPPPAAPPPPSPALRGPGNLDSGYSPSYSNGPTGPGNM